MGHVVEEAEGVGIGEWAVLAPAFDVVAALDVVEAAEVAPVGAGEEAALVVEFYAEGIAAAFCEDFEKVFIGVVAPDGLAEKIGRSLLFSWNFYFHFGGAGGTLCAVDPAIGTAGERVGDGVRVLQAKA